MQPRASASPCRVFPLLLLLLLLLHLLPLSEIYKKNTKDLGPH